MAGRGTFGFTLGKRRPGSAAAMSGFVSPGYHEQQTKKAYRSEEE